MTSLLAPSSDLQSAALHQPVTFIDFDFSTLSEASVLARLAERAADAPFEYIVTPNVDHAVRLQRNRSDLYPVYHAAWLTLCDSKILALLARRAGYALPVLAGSDLTHKMFERIIKPDDVVTIIGGDATRIKHLAARYGLRRVHHYNPPMGFINDPDAVSKAARFVVEARARYSFLAVGSPQQEILAHRIKQLGGGRGIGFCIGASLDFLTGTQKRAPAIMRFFALEWLHRLASDPARMWRRYLYDGPEIFRIVRDWKRRQPR